MSEAIAGLVGAVIGACVVIIDTVITSRNELRLEREKAHLSKQEALSVELRGQVAEVAQQMLSAQHSMEWIAWHAKRDAALINERLIAQYHEEIHHTFPKLLGTLAVVASLNLDIYTALSALAEKIYAIDSSIAQALVDYEQLDDDAIQTLVAIHTEAIKLYQTLPVDLARIMKMAQ